VSSQGTLINFANAGGYDSDGTPFPPNASNLFPGQGGSTEDGNSGGWGDINWTGEHGNPGLVAPNFQFVPAAGAGNSSGTGFGLPGGVSGSLGFTLIELTTVLGTYNVGGQFNSVGGKGGRAGGPFSGGGWFGYNGERVDPLGPGTGSSGGQIVWSAASTNNLAPNGGLDNAGQSSDGMVVIEEYY
jgi:hypothetical protein